MTSRSVYLWDRLAGAVIRGGGIAVLACVLGICLYLVLTALPLFRSGSATTIPAPALPIHELPRLAVLGEYGQAVALLGPDATLRSIALPGGEVFSEVRRGDRPREVAVVSAPDRAGLVAVAFADGGVDVGTIRIDTRILADAEVPASAASIPIGASVPVVRGAAGVLIERTGERQFRESTAASDLRPVILPGAGGPIARLDFRGDPGGARFLATLAADGAGVFGTVRSVRPLGGGIPRERLTSTPFSIVPPAPGAGIPDWLFIAFDGRHLLALWRDGTLQRYVTPSAATPGMTSPPGIRLVETVSVLDGAGVRLSAAGMLLGGVTLVVADDAGGLRAYQPARDPASPAADAMRTVRSSARRFDAPVSALAMSGRERVVAVGLADGTLVVHHLTSGKDVVEVDAGFGDPVATAAVSPRGDTLFAIGQDGRSAAWAIDRGHAESSLGVLFGRRVYEGEAAPRWTYQSSAADDAAEVKMSLVPLIYGTLKATVVGMFLAVPLAVLAAIYTSEFMRPEARRVIKPAVEMMASLPSVVLGFIAAMVLAPYVRQFLPAILLAVVAVPLGVLMLAHLWMILPQDARTRLSRRWRLGLIAVAVGIMVAASAILARPIERTLFVPSRADRLVAAGSFEPLPPDAWPAWVGRRDTMSADQERRLRVRGLYFRAGAVVRPVDAPDVTLPPATGDLRRWLDGGIGRPWPGWFLALALPGVLCAWLIQSRIDRRRTRSPDSSPRSPAVLEAARFALAITLGLCLAAASAALLGAFGLDPRDSVFGPFSQRNALVVGIIMGFAVIPLVYTISEDALRSVPNALRSASLGVGATAWQTALRVVLPAAGSGVFSACMIGLGRAVGETMIVLMATGNTPEMTPNIFSGFRTLAANIAVELPEAEKGGTHYRVLFLCGLVLFAMTFVINTSAEVVRQRVRRRTAAL